MKDPRLTFRGLAVFGLVGACLGPLACSTGGGDDLGADEANSSSAADDATSVDETGKPETSDEETTGQSACGDTYPEGPYGSEAGDLISDMSFTRGDGSIVSLSSFHNEDPRALVIMSTAAW